MGVYLVNDENNEQRSISFPQDKADHPYSNMEWWYCYAFLTGDRGNRYTWMTSWFQVGELPAPKGHYMIHSLHRLDEGQSESSSYIDRTLVFQMVSLYLPLYLMLHPTDWKAHRQYKTLLQGTIPAPHLLMPQASVQSSPTRLKYGQSQWVFSEDHPNFHIHIHDESSRLNLQFIPEKPISIIDERGELNGHQYYSMSRNQVVGQLQSSGVTETLLGEGWFDHQWGRDYGLLHGSGWNWFGLQLEDGRELLINQRLPTGSSTPDVPIAKLIGKDSVITTTKNVALHPLSYWRSPTTGITYPVEWQIQLPELSMNLHVIPLLHDQEMQILGPLQAIWEGACTLNGESLSPPGFRTPVKGKGFIELVGYARQRE